MQHSSISRLTFGVILYAQNKTTQPLRWGGNKKSQSQLNQYKAVWLHSQLQEDQMNEKKFF